ncbi:MAG: shikimate kinase [Elusimicrobia bacterium]|nr:shikimate kinase [Candidatus Obscuribacterium magneticum]
MLVGFMGSGKSQVGRLLAKRLGWPLYDTDEILVRKTGQSIADIFRIQGEKAFREIEKGVVKDASAHDRCVIASGGGAILDPESFERLQKKGELVWLKVSPAVVVSRVKDVASRPLLDPKDPLESVQERLAAREKFYAQASHTIDTDSLRPEEIVEKIIQTIPALKA